VLEFKPFYIHASRPVFKTDNSRYMHMPRGFTAFIQPSAGDRIINVQIAYCSAKDQFCKKTGRFQAVRKDYMYMNPRKLGQFLELAAIKCDIHTNFEYVYKHLV